METQEILNRKKKSGKTEKRMKKMVEPTTSPMEPQGTHRVV